MKLLFTYSIDSEVARVKSTLAKSEFYLNNNYHPLLPTGYTLKTNGLSGLEQVVENELEESAVYEIKEQLNLKWIAHEINLMELFKGLSTNLPRNIDCVLTKYGVGGSYQVPNKVIINFKFKNHFKVLIHEFIHCLVQPIIDSEKLDHASKEGLVDWLFINTQILKVIFPEYKVQGRSNLPNEELIDTLSWGDFAS